MIHPLYNNPILKDRRRDLRRNMTPAERKLWSQLRYEKIEGLRFFRQYSVGPYILDFYCPAKRLAVELDGGQHALPENAAYDQERTKYLEDKNIRVIRFWNNEVMENMSGVIESIKLIMNSSLGRQEF